MGFHGCDAKVRDALLTNPNEIMISKEPYDWLGHGMYFWENNYERALQWANDKMKRGRIEMPAVIGAVLYLGYCCDLTDSRYIRILTDAHKGMVDEYKTLKKTLPQNRDLPFDKHKDKILRELDCVVIEYMHSKIFDQVQTDIEEKGFSEAKVFDSTRGMFTEGGPAFEGSGLYAKTHTQICIRNLNCIQGFFLPRQQYDFMRSLSARKIA